MGFGTKQVCALLPAALLGCGLVVFVVGCRARTRADYIPSEERCRQALSTALEAWKRGEPAGRIEGTPTIQVVDARRRAGQRLENYEILGELPGDDGRRFAVRVALANPKAEERIDFILIGIDPVWIFRQDEYDMVTHWEHNMPGADGGKKVSPPKK